ncbi:carboxypeptidase-like regulatory domain-containing protein [Chitinophaga sp. XS-30]|uniref:TonB-dependent receptor n=1 Tax=Chitinophaga sp. XS-30 TaxID=2604421 RepID=UPI001AEF700B|nr:carboxypeptidase-like regulatory domain-containing protein [Chitinophaga sp. XS-30]
MRSHFTCTYRAGAGMLLLLFLALSSFAQQYRVAGTVYDTDKKPLPYAAITMSAYGITAQSDATGRFQLLNVPAGTSGLNVRFLGKEPIDTLVQVNRDLELQLTLRNADFRLEEVRITATTANTNGTSSRISRTAMDHLQANSLADVMALLPGGIITNPDLSLAKQINIRSVGSSASDMNAFGASVMLNGAPVSNNANLQTMTPAVSGGTAALAGGASPGGGYDVRGISMNNVESVEVIRGVPGVEYGDVTSGVVIVNTKAGVQPLKVQGRTNASLYQLSLNRGFNLGSRKGALNVGVDYARNTNDPVQQYLRYERFTASTMYSNTLFGRLASTTSLDLIYGKDTRDRNPDDEITKTASSGKDLGLIFNTRGNIRFNKSWLRNFNYVARIGYTARNSFYETQYTAANAPYSMTTTDGSVLTNHPDRNYVDADGNQLNTSHPADAGKYAVYLPSTYLGRYDINGRELNTFFKTAATFFNRIGQTNHRWILGADFKTDRNFGAGKTFADSAPPYRNLSAQNATFRKRAYKDIPGINQLGLYAEDNFSTRIGGHRLEISAGMRYGVFSGSRTAFSPRINASVDVVPGILSINGAYGQLAKAPSVLYLHPEDAYFEYININETATSSIPEDQRVFMTTTRVFSTKNNSLEIAKNKKSELGLRLNIKQATLRVTGFREDVDNGYTMGNSLSGFKPLVYNEYTRNGTGAFELSASNNVLASFYMPTNNLVARTKGLEMDLDLGRFKAIRTAFALNGAIMHTQSYNKDYLYFDDFSGNAGSARTHIGLYEPGMEKRYNETAVTTLRTTHNIPRLGFVVTLTTQVIWSDRNWYRLGNDSIPVKYISKDDGLVYDFDASKREEPEFKALLRNVNRTSEIMESYPPLLTFNVNVTKEIADYLRVSFFANNAFRAYQRAESKRVPGTYTRRGNQYFFGLELSLTL